ncbi:MAG: J domain-containing protein [Thermoplasmata archaeon]
MAKRDYYEVLGIPKAAGADEVKSAYRRLARQHHPDVSKESKKIAEEKFKEISEAYEVLADAEKRRRYDQMGFSGVESDFGPGGFTWQNFTHVGDLEDLLGASPIFRQFFGDLGGQFGTGSRRVESRGRDVELTVRLPITAAVTGAHPTVDVPRSTPCTDCRGTGAKYGTAIETCSECGGQGQVRRVQNRGFTQLISIGECPRCHGTGRRILEPCPACGGRGELRSNVRIELNVPPGIEDGAILRVPGHGMGGRPGARSGDLYVQVSLESSPNVRREGLDAYSDATVPLATALLGGEITIPTIEAHTALKVPAGTQPETQFRLRGKGFPRLSGGGRGDLIVTLHVEIPRSLSSRERDLVREAFGQSTEAPTGRRESIFRRRSS